MRLWDPIAGKEVRQYDTGHWLTRSVAFHPSGSWLVAAAKDETIRAWDVATGRPLGEPVPVERELMNLAFRPDGRRLAGAGSDGTIRVWDLPAGTWLATAPTWRLPVHKTDAWAVAYSPDGRVLASASERGVVLADGETHERRVTLRGVEGQVRTLSFSDDGELLAASTYVRPATVFRLPALRRALAEAGLDW